jgi:hypothetical protein
MGAGEIFSAPANGVYIARMMKIAEETPSAPTANVTSMMAFGEAKRPKLKIEKHAPLPLP